MKKLGAAAALFALVVLLAACDSGGGPPPKPVYPATINLSGDITLDGATFVRGNLSNCAGAGRFADLIAGAPVTVSNRAGQPLAVGSISYGIGTNVYQNHLDECTFRFHVLRVPRTSSYIIKVAQQAPVSRDFLSLYRYGGTLQFKLPPKVVTTTTTLPLPAASTG